MQIGHHNSHLMPEVSIDIWLISLGIEFPEVDCNKGGQFDCVNLDRIPETVDV
jgi:hypothetical protein